MILKFTFSTAGLGVFYNTSGVYGVRCKKNNKWYVGQSRYLQSRYLQRRYKDHLNSLNKGEHANQHLQRAFDKYSADQFEFHLLKKCGIDDLNTIEQEYIKRFNSKDLNFGYNICHVDNGRIRYTESFAETIRNSRSKSFKITANDAKVIRELYAVGYTPGVIIEKYRMSPRHISRILSNEIWPDPDYTKPKVVPHLNPVQVSTIEKLNREGYGVNAISGLTGIGHYRINKFFDKPLLKSSGKGKMPVLNTITGIFYPTVKEAATAHDIPRSTFEKRLFDPNNTTFVLV